MERKQAVISVKTETVAFPCWSESFGLFSCDIPIPTGGRITPIAGKRNFSNFDAKRRLAAFIFIAMQHFHHAFYRGSIKTRGNYILNTLLPIDIYSFT
jgi:hypothetical protein